MALIKCTECGRDISDRASNCPGCGAPTGSAGVAMSGGDAVAAVPRVQTVEQTGKRWKAQQLLAVLLVCISVVVIIAGGASTSVGAEVAGSLMLAAGAIWFVVARIGAWWHHG